MKCGAQEGGAWRPVLGGGRGQGVRTAGLKVKKAFSVLSYKWNTLSIASRTQVTPCVLPVIIFATSVSTYTKDGWRKDRGPDRSKRLSSPSSKWASATPTFRPGEGNALKSPLAPCLVTLEMEMVPVMENKFKYEAG